MIYPLASTRRTDTQSYQLSILSLLDINAHFFHNLTSTAPPPLVFFCTLFKQSWVAELFRTSVYLA